MKTSTLSIPGANSVAIAVALLALSVCDGTATLPGDPPLAGPAQPPQQVASQADAAEGLHHYDAYCIRCHGPTPWATT